VLESLQHDKHTGRIIHIIRPTIMKNIFTMGRSSSVDLKIDDISISRVHSRIRFEEGKFILEDNNSKFGTMVLVKQLTPLLPGYDKAI